MITKDNYKDVIKAITPKDKKRILNSAKEYCILQIHIFNSGCCVSVNLTKNFRNISYLEAIFYTDTIINEIKNTEI